MAFLELYPPEGMPWLDNAEIIERLQDEFEWVESDAEEGRDHVAGMIAAMLRFSDKLPGKQEQLKQLLAIQDYSVMVHFGDDTPVAATCCLIPENRLFFGSTEEVEGSARGLVERCARALNYELFEG